MPGLTPAARRVLDVASDLFYTRGINTVGMDLIAAEAGVTKKTIYDRFGSKDALVLAYLRARDQRWRGWVRDHLAGVGDARQRVLATFDALQRWLDAGEGRGCAMINACAELSDPAHPGRAVAGEQKRWMRDLLAELVVAAGGQADLADQLLILHEGAVVARTVAAQERAVECARRGAETLLDAALARC